MAEIGAVARQFKEQGYIVIDGKSEIVEDKGRSIEKITPFDAEQLEMEIIELAIENMNIEGATAEVYTSKADFITVRKEIAELKYHIAEADIHFFAENLITLQEEDQAIFDHILETLQEDEDVDQVYHNVNL